MSKLDDTTVQIYEVTDSDNDTGIDTCGYGYEYSNTSLLSKI